MVRAMYGLACPPSSGLFPADSMFASQPFPTTSARGVAAQPHLGTARLRTQVGVVVHVGPVCDHAVIVLPASRWNNYYVKGIDQIMHDYNADGLYLDEIACVKKEKKIR